MTPGHISVAVVVNHVSSQFTLTDHVCAASSESIMILKKRTEKEGLQKLTLTSVFVYHLIFSPSIHFLLLLQGQE